MDTSDRDRALVIEESCRHYHRLLEQFLGTRIHYICGIHYEYRYRVLKMAPRLFQPYLVEAAQNGYYGHDSLHKYGCHGQKNATVETFLTDFLFPVYLYHLIGIPLKPSLLSLDPKTVLAKWEKDDTLLSNIIDPKKVRKIDKTALYSKLAGLPLDHNNRIVSSLLKMFGELRASTDKGARELVADANSL